MSYTEIHQGRIRVVTYGVKETLRYFKVKLPLDPLTEEVLTDPYKFYEYQEDIFEGEPRYKFKYGRLLRIIDEEFEDEGYFSKSSLDERGEEISYHCMFYNGGTCLDEHIDEYIDEHFKTKSE